MVCRGLTSRCLKWVIPLIGWLAISCTARAQADETVYTDALVNGWQNWSWATVNLSNNNPVQSGSASIAVSAGPYQAVYLHHDAFASSLYGSLVFWINGGSTGGQLLQVQAELSGNAQTAVTLPALAASGRGSKTFKVSRLTHCRPGGRRVAVRSVARSPAPSVRFAVYRWPPASQIRQVLLRAIAIFHWFGAHRRRRSDDFILLMSIWSSSVRLWTEDLAARNNAKEFNAIAAGSRLV